MGSLEDFIQTHPDSFSTKVDAARHRDKVWAESVNAPMQSAFGTAKYQLNLQIDKLLPSEYLKRAQDLLERIDLESESITDEPNNLNLSTRIKNICYEIKKRFEKLERKKGTGTNFGNG